MRSPLHEHIRKRQIDAGRGSAARRGYDRAWWRARRQKLQTEPRCEFCLERGKLSAATVVDHIIPIAERPDLRLVQSNLRSACKSCHDARTAADHGFNRGKQVFQRTGFDANGWPDDPEHEWNKKR